MVKNPNSFLYFFGFLESPSWFNECEREIKVCLIAYFFWHVYRQSVLVIDGKNHNDDGMFSGKNNKNDGMITGRKCQSGTISLLGRRRREILRIS
jgi:hypothetical protein